MVVLIPLDALLSEVRSAAGPRPSRVRSLSLSFSLFQLPPAQEWASIVRPSCYVTICVKSPTCRLLGGGRLVSRRGRLVFRLSFSSRWSWF